MVEDDLEAEFLLQSQHGEDVIMPVGVVVHDAFAVEDVGEGFEGEIALEGFVGIVFSKVLGAFLLVGLGVEEALADEGGGFTASAGEGSVVADGIGAVGHLDATGEGAVGELDGEVFDGVSFAEFEVDRLAGEEEAGAGHEVGGGDAAGAGFVDTGVADVDGVERADRGLDGRGAIATGNLADVGVGADEAGDDRLAGAIDLLGPGRNVDLVCGACGENGIAPDKEGGVFDLGSGDRVEGGVGVGLERIGRGPGLFVGSREEKGERQEGSNGEGEKLARSHGDGG